MRSAILCAFLCLAAQASDSAAVRYTITTVAGGTYCGDGQFATYASLGSPEGLAADRAGNLYIADAIDHRVRRIAADGMVTTIAGNGYPGYSGDGGAATAAQLNAPYGLALDGAGNLYVADLGNAHVRRIAANGTITTVATDLALVAPRNVAVDAAGNLYISDFADHRVYKIGTDGTAARIAGLGWAGSIPDGAEVKATDAPLNSPAGLAMDAAGVLYIADSGNGRVRKIQDGVMSTVVTGSFALGLPTGLALGSDGALYVADKALAQVVRIYKGAAGIAAGTGERGYAGDGEQAADAALNEPREVAFDAEGNLYTADLVARATGNIGVVRRKLAEGTMETFAGAVDFRPGGDRGVPLEAHFESPSGIAVAANNVLYITDPGDHRVRRIADGMIDTFTNYLDQPNDAVFDWRKRLTIADAGGNGAWQVSSQGLLVRVAGEGDAGYTGDGGTATEAQLNGPRGVAADASGNLFIADTLNHAVRKVRTDGRIVTLAGSDSLNGPVGVAVDQSGNVYVADSGNHRIQRIDAAGAIRTVAGNGTAGAGGDGGDATLAELNTPLRVAVDASGSLFIADTGNHRIRRVAADGTITTIAGTGKAGFSGDDGPALEAQLNEPAALAFDTDGSLLIADRGNQRIRKLTPGGAVVDPPAAVEASLVNTASLAAGAVAPGELVTVTGTGLGPAAGASGSVTDGRLATKEAGIEVLFDGTAAPVLYAQSSRVNVQVPYEVAGKAQVAVEVRINGVVKARSTAKVTDTAPAIFTVSGGTGQAAATNEDGQMNSASAPARAGSIVTLFATGEGQTDPAGVTGKLAAAPYPAPEANVTVLIGGEVSEVLFRGEAPGYAGLLQLNVRVPKTAGTGAQAVELRMGGAKSQAGVTLAVE